MFLAKGRTSRCKSSNDQEIVISEQKSEVTFHVYGTFYTKCKNKVVWVFFINNRTEQTVMTKQLIGTPYKIYL